jgi:hypothetical protein
MIAAAGAIEQALGKRLLLLPGIKWLTALTCRR